MNPPPLDRVSADLVEYVIVAVPGVDALGRVAASLTALVERQVIRILDLVVVARHPPTRREVAVVVGRHGYGYSSGRTRSYPSAGVPGAVPRTVSWIQFSS